MLMTWLFGAGALIFAAASCRAHHAVKAAQSADERVLPEVVRAICALGAVGCAGLAVLVAVS